MDIIPASATLPASTLPGHDFSPLLGGHLKATTDATRPHLNFLDGIRGLTALYVMHSHLLYYTDYLPHANRVQSWIFNIFYLGHYAVAVFIVLSGYCLTLPTLRCGGHLNSSYFSFVRRRAWRILPPYYGTLIVCALIEVLKCVCKSPGSLALSRPVDWVTHLVLIHNLTPSTTYTITGPLWSIATEWHIYFLFPLVLLPIWRRGGAICTVISGLMLGIFIWQIFPSTTYGCPWFIGLFAFGMAAAKLSHADDGFSIATLRLLKWSSALLFACSYMLSQLFPEFTFKVYPEQNDNFLFPIFDILFGAATAIYLIYGARSLLTGGEAPASIRFLSSKLLVRIGAFSYSLYLVHMPLLGLINFIGKRLAIAPSLKFVWMLTVGCTVTIILSYFFYLAIERPSLQFAKRQKT